MSSPEAFISVACDEPDDVGRRLVFADWCEDNGDTDRAEFIRAQVRLEEMPEYDPDRLDLEERALDLLAAHRAEWLGKKLPAWARREAITFRRGLPGEMRLNGGKFLGNAEKLTRAAPLIRLTLDGLPERIGDLASSEATKRLAELEIMGVAPDALRFREFFRRFHSENLRHLGVEAEKGRVMGLDAPSEWPVMERLESLSLRRMRFTPESLAALLDPQQMRSLRRLELSGTTVAGRVVRAISRHARLTDLTLCDVVKTENCAALAGAEWELRSLKLWTREPEANVVELGQAAWLSGLRSLDTMCDGVVEALAGIAPGPAHLALHREPSRDAGDALLASDLAAGLTSLATTQWSVTDPKKASRLAGLKRLTLSAGDDTHYLLGAAIEAPHLAGVRELTVTGRPLMAEGESRLPRLPGLARLRSLTLHCWLSDRALVHLARSPHLAGLRRLDLSGNDFGDEGVRAAEVDAPWLSSLRELGLCGSRVTWAGVTALARCEALANLRVLELYRYGLGEDGAAALAESPHLGRLLRLRLRGRSWRGGAAAEQRLRERFGGVLEVE